MSAMVHLLSLHEWAAHLPAMVSAATPSPSPSVTPPNPPPIPPPGLKGPVDTILGWGKWGVLVSGVAGLFICGGQMAIGRKNRSQLRR